jgi:hypothetical protein
MAGAVSVAEKNGSTTVVSKVMKWISKFPKPILLKDGRSIASLIQARDLIATLPPAHLKNAHWEYATDLVFDAARHGDEASILAAYQHLLGALKKEGLL